MRFLHGFTCGVARPFLVEALEPLPERLSERLLSFEAEAVSLEVLWNHTCFTTEQHILHVHGAPRFGVLGFRV